MPTIWQAFERRALFLQHEQSGGLRQCLVLAAQLLLELAHPFGIAASWLRRLTASKARQRGFPPRGVPRGSLLLAAVEGGYQG